MKPGMIFDIQRFSTHDGPGIRTVVFFKGCPLACAWCENPESQSSETEILHDPKRCVGCRACLDSRFGGAMRETDRGIEPDRGRIPGSELAGVCPSLALRAAGREAGVAEIVAEVMKDAVFFRQSGGGATFSGGEPLMQHRIVLACVRELASRGIGSAVETCLAVEPAGVESVLTEDVHWLLDLKHVDTEIFRRGTGGDATLVLANIRRVAESARRVTFRIPVIPEFNDDEKSMNGILDFIAALKRADARPPQVDLLPFHDLAAGKYALLGRADPYSREGKLNPKTLSLWRETARAKHFQVGTGG